MLCRKHSGIEKKLQESVSIERFIVYHLDVRIDSVSLIEENKQIEEILAKKNMKFDYLHFMYSPMGGKQGL